MLTVAQTSLFSAQSVKVKNIPRQSFPDLSPADRKKVSDHLRDRALDLAGSDRETDRRLGWSLSVEADRFCQCGSQFAAYACDPCRLDFRSPVSCNSRLCSKCGRRQARKWRQPIIDKCKSLLAQRRKGWNLMLLTLTTDSARYAGGMPNRKDIRRLHRETADFLRLFYGKYEAHVTAKGRVIETKRRFSYDRTELGVKVKVRRNPIVRQGRKGLVTDWRVWRGSGGVAAMELGMRRGTNHAGELNNNLHFHALIYAPYISQRRLSEAWNRITVDSYIVDIRAVKTVAHAANYVLKYMSKPPAVESYSELANYAEAIKGSRRLKTAGVFYNGLEIEKKEKLKVACPCCQDRLTFKSIETILDLESSTLMPLWPVLFRLARGEPVELIRRHDPIFENAQKLIAAEMGVPYPKI